MYAFRASLMSWKFGAAAVLAAVLLLCGAGDARAQATREYAIKAAFLYKFGDFIIWPSAGPEFRVCVFGHDPFGPALDGVVAGERVGERPVVVARHASFQGGEACDVAYLGGLPAAELRTALTALRADAVLTVTDEATNGEIRGIVHFALRQNRVRFYIDTAQVKENGLTVRSNLLELAILDQKRGATQGTAKAYAWKQASPHARKRA